MMNLVKQQNVSLKALLCFFSLTLFALSLVGPTQVCLAGGDFGLDQQTGNSQGTIKRYISMSSPFSGAYYHEDMTVVGRASVTESFRMDNLRPVREESFDLGFGEPQLTRPNLATEEDLGQKSSSPSNADSSSVTTLQPVLETETFNVSPRPAYPRWWDLF